MIYNLLRFILYLVISGVSIFNKKLRLFFKKRLCQNFKNNLFEDRKTEIILIHMSSVGEFNLSKELIERLLRKNEKIIISIMTDTGKEAAERIYGNNQNVKVIYFPLDDYILLLRIFELYKIKKTIIIETEIWPNLYSIAGKKSELYIVNGRLTAKKMKSYMKMKRLSKKILNKASKIMVQSEEDKERYLKLEVEKNKLKIYKNLKYSIKYETLTEERKNKYFETIISKDKKIIVCGSTRSGEEKIWIEVFKSINSEKEYQLIIVPRHIERIDEIINETDNILYGKESCSLFSENKKSDIVIVNKMGILRELYQIADFVFVGGTLVNIGGHSILEPLFYGKLPIIGSYYENIEEIVKEAEKMGFVKIVNDKDEITDYLRKSQNIDTSEFFRKNNEIDGILEELYK
ncbi:3-deoxy-D-manno-octulosonic acid transferase [Leptotrichia sp. OH3620_COT-345]|uniref:3-deoxy-D-manno-octulosonic acid transferase n=1 Tax=Leptotrichia sp. OH3620_COT-345 TaxID=2491048 RepID=UPI001F24D7D3|nr:glycosyltransferase N-terminal domain-containing protein [Leptotrichia sp. OH3620_COT-345]